jgi:hypothetical protein
MAALMAASSDPSLALKVKEMDLLTEQLAGTVNALIRFYYPLDIPNEQYERRCAYVFAYSLSVAKSGHSLRSCASDEHCSDTARVRSGLTIDDCQTLSTLLLGPSRVLLHFQVGHQFPMNSF